MSLHHHAQNLFVGTLLFACLSPAQTYTRSTQQLPPRIVTPAPPPRIASPPPQPRVQPTRPAQPTYSAPPPRQPTPAPRAETPSRSTAYPSSTYRTLTNQPTRSTNSSSPSRTNTPTTSSVPNNNPRNASPYRSDLNRTPPVSDPTLTGRKAGSLINQANASRIGLTGINAQPLPKGQVTVHPGGAFSLNTRSGTHYEVRSNGTVASLNTGAQSARFFPNGHIAAVHTGNLDISHGLHGEQTIVTRRPDGTALVSTGPHTGFLEKRFHSGGHGELVQRTYVIGGRVQTRIYLDYRYYGITLQRYLPAVYFAPALYGWAYYPWTPMPFQWGWASAPWFGFYHGYFAPYATYPSGYAWLTDYYLSNLLASSFNANATANDDTPEPDHAYAQSDTPISPELKNDIADEVQHQLALANSAASGHPDPSQTELSASIQPNHIFVVSESMQVSTEDQQSCALSSGDVLRLTAPPQDGLPLAKAKVASGKRADCPAGVTVFVSLNSLQDMQNDLRAEMDNGLAELQDHQGRDGWPQPPASALAVPPRPAIDGLPPADPSAAGLLEAQRSQAAQTEATWLTSAINRSQ